MGAGAPARLLNCSSSFPLKQFVQKTAPRKNECVFVCQEERRNKAAPHSEHFTDSKRLPCLVVVPLCLFLKVNKASADEVGGGRGAGCSFASGGGGGVLRRHNRQRRTKGAAAVEGGGVSSQLAPGGG